MIIRTVSDIQSDIDNPGYPRGHPWRADVVTLLARVAELEPVFSKVCALLTDNGPCDGIEEDSDDVHCGDDYCHYCELNRLASAVDETPPTPDAVEPYKEKDGGITCDELATLRTRAFTCKSCVNTGFWMGKRCACLPTPEGEKAGE